MYRRVIWKFNPSCPRIHDATLICVQVQNLSLSLCVSATLSSNLSTSLFTPQTPTAAELGNQARRRHLFGRFALNLLQKFLRSWKPRRPEGRRISRVSDSFKRLVFCSDQLGGKLGTIWAPEFNSRVGERKYIFLRGLRGIELGRSLTSRWM